MLRFMQLQENLRRLLWSRIDRGELTGMSLADRAGFRQAHISNFLNRKRGLSFDGIDRILNVEEISVMDLIPPDEVNARASIPPPAEDDYANIFLVAPATARYPQIHARSVLEVLKFKQSFIRRLKPDCDKQRAQWLRFVMIKPCRDCCELMAPRLSANCTVLIDRHYNSFTPYRREHKNIYAIRAGNEILVRYAHLDRSGLMADPESRAPNAFSRHIPVPAGLDPPDLILGRVAHISMEA
jgi:hypothetical protein